jgi:hypothetical protein
VVWQSDQDYLKSAGIIVSSIVIPEVFCHEHGLWIINAGEHATIA